MHQQDERNLFAFGLEFRCEREDILVNFIVHADNHVNASVILQSLPCYRSRLYPYECRRIRHVQTDIFLIYLRFYMPVFFHDESVIIAANHQYPVDSEPYQGVEVCISEIFRFRCVVHNH